jgi:serine/threonine protein kinase
VTEEPGQLIAGRYLLGRCLARGGMGSVWETQHVGLEARVALKLLRPELGQDEAHIERFRREARAAAKLKSPHVVGIYDCGVDRGTPYIAMEFLEGEDLELRLGRLGHLELMEALTWLEQAARGLSVAHAAGLVHRDVKPANLFIERLPTGERLKVVDFGIARQGSTESTLTTGSGVWGSPAYMSPEQARGRAVDQRTDVWALAGVFYRMLTGQLPFRGLTEHDTIVEVCTGRLRPPSELDPSLPRALDEVFVRALAKDPAERTVSVEVLAQEAADALGVSLSPFELQGKRHLAQDPTRPSPAGEMAGRVTETKPLGVDTVTHPLAGSRHHGRLRLGLLAFVVLALAATAWSLNGRRKANPRVEAPAPATAAVPSAVSPPSPVAEPIAPPAFATPHPTSVATASPRRPTPKTTQPDTKRSSKNSGVHSGEPGAPESAPTDPLFGLPLEENDTK